jgi:hypothetical protein
MRHTLLLILARAVLAPVALVAVALVAAVVALLPQEAAAQAPDQTREIQQLRKEVQELRAAVRELQQSIGAQQHVVPAPTSPDLQQQQLEAEIRAAMPQSAPPQATPATPPAEVAAAPAAQPPSGAGVGKSSALLNPDISFIGDFTFLGTDNNQLNKANRFSFREAEVGFQAPIDPFARADAFITFSESETPDVEEAYATFLTLPYNLQARAGKFRVSFGKNNLLHRHALPQTDRPFAEVDNFGDEGLKGTGVGVSYLLPNPWDQYVLLSGEVVNGLDQEAGGAQGTPLAQQPAARVLRDFAGVGHVQSFFDVDADNNIELGASALINLPKSGDQTKIYGVDLTYRWRPLGQAGYRQFLWRSEGYFTERELRGANAAALPMGESPVFNTAGFYTYGEYRLTQRLWLGTRIDWTEIPAQRRQTEWGVYPYFTFSPTEFGYFRLGYQYAESDQLRDKLSDRVWLQYDFSIGPHGAHAF